MIASVVVAMLEIASILGGAWCLSTRRRAGLLLANLPKELRGARLLYAEQLFTANSRPSISARVDRAYRLRSGVVVLLELKTRKIDRPYLSDAIELSAQRVALELQTGEAVADHAFVAVKRHDGNALSIHRVRLMPITDVIELAARRDAIIAGRLAPGHTRSAGVCRRCAFASCCEHRLIIDAN